MIFPEGIFSFAGLLTLAIGFICLEMKVTPWKLWTYNSHTERDS